MAFTSNTHSTELVIASSQYWSIADASQTGLDVAGDMTLHIRFNVPSFATVQVLMAKLDTNGNQRAYSLRIADANTIFAVAYEDGTSANTTDFSFGSLGLLTDTWSSVTAVFTAATPAWALYLDGVSKTPTSNEALATTIFNSTAPFFIGAAFIGGVADLFTGGKLDDPRVWSRALTSTEASDLHTDPCNFANGASLQGQWLFDNNALDETANNNDLTGTNTPTFTTDVAYSCGTRPPGLTATGSFMIV